MTYLFLYFVISLGHIVHLRVFSSCHRSQKIFSDMFTGKKKKLAYKWMHTIETHVVQGSIVYAPWWDAVLSVYHLLRGFLDKNL